MKLKRLLAVMVVTSILSGTLIGCRKHVSVPVFTYEENEDGTLTITGLTDKGKEDINIKVPNKIDGKDVTIIGAGAFRDHETVLKVEISEGITTISENAFLNCYVLNDLTIPESVTSIGTNAFTNTDWEHAVLVKNNEVIVNGILCKVKAVDGAYSVPSDVVAIASGVFYNNDKLTEITLPDKLESIGTYAFAGCVKLKEIKLPEGLKSIGYGAFADCGIESIDVPATVQTIGNEAFLGMEKVNYKGSADGRPWGAKN